MIFLKSEIKNKDLNIIIAWPFTFGISNKKNVDPAYANKVAIAAPIIPILGINIKFRTMLTTAPKAVRTNVNLFKFSAIRYWVLATPKNTNTPAQICTDKTGAA
jgi:predicted Abi (CAAX) family protease